ncbi:MAG: hypothetical protein KAH56_11520 [Candidatus Krumholzibacteria bacterium]|nr:hypothetical protein [Candidatus Krumholzibacteria bacterium]
MNARQKIHLILTAALILMVSVSAASAQIALRFTPLDTTIAPGDTTRVSVMLDDAVYFRTIELTVTYDSTLIRTVRDSSGQGALFTDSGFFIWESFEEDVPGHWHGFAAIMGARDSVCGPGELFAWEVEGLIEGTTAITSIETILYEPNANIIPGVTLDPTTLRVRIPASAVGDLPAYQTSLDLYPNPFNPRTRIGFDLPAAGHILLVVFDARGRRVATLHEGATAAGPVHFDWDGRNDSGLVQPGGVYLFRLDSRQDGVTHTATTKGILLK